MIEHESPSYKLQRNMYEQILEDWRTILRHPHPDLLKLLLEFTKKHAAPSVTKKDVEAFLRSIFRQTPRRIASKTFDVPVMRKGPYTNRIVTSASFGDEPVELTTSKWNDLVLSVCERLALENPEDFERVLSQVTSARSRLYFTKQQEELTRPALIRGTEIYVEQNISSNNAVALCETLTELFGYFPKFKVEIR